MSDEARRGLIDLQLILEEMSVAEEASVARRVRAFVTGSRAYGKFDALSDVDVVLLLSEEDRNVIREAMHEQWVYTTTTAGFANIFDPQERVLPPNLDNPDFGKDYPTESVKFGKLNLLMCTNPRQFECWYVGTQELKKRKPVTREEAVLTFGKLRKEYGLYPGEDPTFVVSRVVLDGAVEA